MDCEYGAAACEGEGEKNAVPASTGTKRVEHRENEAVEYTCGLAVKISVVIATINRREELRTTILAYRRQTHPEVEIVIVDNGSTDGSREMVETEFPDVLYRWLPYNMGTHAINMGFEMATGDVFWLSNNDSYPEDEQLFTRLAAYLNEFPHVHIVGSEDIEANDGYRVFHWHPVPVDKSAVPPEGFPTNLFHGTGAAVRRQVVEAIGGFWDVFVFEELDFCTRAIVAGFNVRYVPAFRTLHFASPRQRVHTERWVAAAKNLMRYHWRHFPFWQAGWRSAVFFLYFLAQGLAYPARPSQYLEVLFGAPGMAFFAWRRERRVIPRAKLEAVTLGQNPLLMIVRHAGRTLRRFGKGERR